MGLTITFEPPPHKPRLCQCWGWPPPSRRSPCCRRPRPGWDTPHRRSLQLRTVSVQVHTHQLHLFLQYSNIRMSLLENKLWALFSRIVGLSRNAVTWACILHLVIISLNLHSSINISNYNYLLGFGQRKCSTFSQTYDMFFREKYIKRKQQFESTGWINHFFVVNLVVTYRKTGHQRPGVIARIISLHTTEPALLRIAHGWGIVTSHRVQETIEDPHCHPAPSSAHVCHTGPLVGVGVIALHWPETGWPITSSYSVQFVVKNGHPTRGPLISHWGHVAPGSGGWVKPFNSVEIAPSVMTSNCVQWSSQNTDT